MYYKTTTVLIVRESYIKYTGIIDVIQKNKEYNYVYSE